MMYIYNIDGIKYSLKSECNFNWLSEIGTVFRVFDENDSGNISFGIDTGTEKLFIKFAGADTVNSGTTPEKSIHVLKDSVSVYKDLKHPLLLEYRDSFEFNNGFATVFKWFDGTSLHSCWRDYSKHDRSNMLPDCVRFWELPIKKKLDIFNRIIEFHISVCSKKYIAIDFYDGSLLYNYDTDELQICDIDFYSKQPYINTMGRMWGSSRFRSPEESQLGDSINEVTNVFTMGAVAFGMFGGVLDRALDKWRLNKEAYNVALKAVSEQKADRYQNLVQFKAEWDTTFMVVFNC